MSAELRFFDLKRVCCSVSSCYFVPMDERNVSKIHCPCAAFWGSELGTQPQDSNWPWKAMEIILCSGRIKLVRCCCCCVFAVVINASIIVKYLNGKGEGFSFISSHYRSQLTRNRTKLLVYCFRLAFLWVREGDKGEAQLITSTQ
jgi:hypothetical protein